MAAAKRVLQYLKSTADFRLHFNGNGISIGIGIDIGNSLAGYSDFYRANDSADRKSQGGHVFLASNGAILWQSREQSLIAMSTASSPCQLSRPSSSPARRPLEKDLHKRRIVNYSYVHTDENVADILTEELTTDTDTMFTKAMGLW